MIRFPSLLTRAAAAAMLGSLLVLAGCHRGSTKDEISAAQARSQFDTVVKAYKSGQFLLDDAVLSALDLGSHFAYLKEQGKLPKTVLLERSDDSKVRKQHLEYMARMQLDYGFAVYYDDDGTLKKINPVDTKARRLEDYRAPVQMNDELKGKSAAGGSFDPSQQH
ncbi:hypothetical protein RHOFW104T7_15190 [Rhodanobacter thiooxydans]|uniref:Uncharacterized protein n=1 Tax=Rhodanobacter thiooxydans TaxID=416169 RepID=A0A154QHQ6_9GAMM|nr:hypothetical protein [Rhodanobacter thiooxydans]KZC23213.1 hypothetical protein RHOFW104T7_15190 [Rhodanobacter thiooxydans]MCW0202010.1 hypothetical protein [Rhodanobacter thiooxydans]